MKQLWLHSVRLYLKIGLFFYFKKITVVNADKVPKDGAVLLLSNHQNALLDALLIATNSGRFSYFLTRASVFNNKLISKILRSLLMIPVYRIRDGWGNLTKNNSVFSSTAKLLSKQKAIVIFPEGSHNLKRTVRPLSKGFARIIFETLDDFPDTKITLVPVGVNFVHAERFADSTLLNFGNAIVVDANSTKSASELKETIFKELCQLTIHINSDDYDETLKKLMAKRYEPWVTGVDSSQEAFDKWAEEHGNDVQHWFEEEILPDLKNAPSSSHIFLDDARDSPAKSQLMKWQNRAFRTLRHKNVGVTSIQHSIRGRDWTSQSYSSVFAVILFPSGSGKGKIVRFLADDIGLGVRRARQLVKEFAEGGRTLLIRMWSPSCLIGTRKLILT